MEPSTPYPEATSQKESRFLRRLRKKEATDEMVAPEGVGFASAPPGSAPVQAPVQAGVQAGVQAAVPAPASASAPAPGPTPAPALKGGLPPGPPDGYGISLSGGGIRAASYGLGVLQEMHRHDMVTGERRAKWLSAVSGGAYVAGGLASVARGHLEEDPDALDLTLQPPASFGEPDGRPFAMGTPEERYLRNHTRYLTHVTGGWSGALWRMLLGIGINVGFIALTLHTLLRPAGWLYGWAVASLRTHVCGAAVSTCQTPAVPWHVQRWGFILLAAAILAGAGTVLGVLWVGVRWEHDRTRALLGYASGVALGLAAVVLIFGVGVVAALHILRTSIGHQVPPTADGISKSSPAASAHAGRILGVAVSGGLLGVILAAAGAIQHAASTSSEFEKATARRVLGLLQRFRGPVLNLLATIAGPALLLLLSLLFISWGAASPPFALHGGSIGELLRWVLPAVLLVVAWWYADLVSWSLHPLYKRGLSLAFTLKRVRAQQGGSPTSVGSEDAMERPYDHPYPLSDMQPPGLPRVLICAAANVSDYGSTPTGSHATSFVFSSDVIGGPLVGAKDTQTYEDAVQWRCTDVTLPAAVSIAGAAFSPSMGKMTRAPLRFILALTNLRLGVWIPNPRRLDEFDARRHFSRHRYTPRPDYLLRELFGLNHLDAPYLYVTDGGHYENLGLVELLRRKCEWIWCVDAAGDTIDGFSTLGEALALAYAELDIAVDLDPTIMAPDPAATGERLVRQPYAIGAIHYPDGTTGRIVFIKAGVSADAPWAVHAYHRKHPGFPCDPTFDQFYDADRFDAYRELGTFAMQKAWEEIGAEFDSYRSRASGTA